MGKSYKKKTDSYRVFNIRWWLRPSTKVTSMSGGNICGCWVSRHQHAPTTILN